MDRNEALRQVSSLYVPWFSNFVLYARRITGSLETAEDVVQEAFIKLFRSLIEDKQIENPKNWLMCVVRHEAISQSERESRQRAKLHEFGMLHEATRNSRATAEPAPDRTAELPRLFAILTDRELEVLLQRMQNLKYKQIASNLGISTNTVKTLLARALRKTRQAASSNEGQTDSSDEVEERIPPTLH